MNEKFNIVDYYRRKPKLVYKEHYQSAARELTYNSLVRTNPNYSIKQPTLYEGRQTIELLPSDTSWDGICLVVHPEGEWLPDYGELIVTIQLTQSMHDRNCKLAPTALEFIEQFNIFRLNSEHLVYRQNLLFDAVAEIQDMLLELDNERLASSDEIRKMSAMINRSRVRPADF